MFINVARKELKSMFASPMGWVILSLMMFAFGTQFLNGVSDYFAVASGAMRPAERIGVTQSVGKEVYGLASFFVLFAVPLLSMRLVAEERRNQTLPFLFSAPISLTEIVVGKFLGLVAFLSLVIIYIALMLSTLNFWTDIDFGYIIANTVGLLLFVASASALGLYFSSMTQHPVIAAILSFIVLYVLTFLDRFFAGDPSNMLANLSLMRHFQSFVGGLIDTGDIAFLLLITLMFLILTIRRLDADRLRG